MMAHRKVQFEVENTKYNMVISEEDYQIAIREKDSNGDTLWAWTFPCVSEHQRTISLRKSCLSESETLAGNGSQKFVFGRSLKHWFYIGCSEVFDSDNLPWVKHFALVLWAKDFSPEKYETLCRILSKTYCKTGDPAQVLRLYLSVGTTGFCTTEENGTFYVKDFEMNQKFSSVNTMAKDLINMFGLEVILIYTALLLKKRVVIYHHSLQALLLCIRTFPALMAHRPKSEALYPWVALVQDELISLKGLSHYIMGCRDSGVISRSDVFDVLVNLPAREITVASHAKESMVMTKTHKDIALSLTQLASRSDSTEQQVLQEVASRTADLLDHLKNFATVIGADNRPLVTVDTLRQQNLAPPLENFLFNLAVAENMIML